MRKSLTVPTFSYLGLSCATSFSINFFMNDTPFQNWVDSCHLNYVLRQMLMTEKANISGRILLSSFCDNSKTVTETEKFSSFIVLEKSIEKGSMINANLDQFVKDRIYLVESSHLIHLALCQSKLSK